MSDLCLTHEICLTCLTHLIKWHFIDISFKPYLYKLISCYGLVVYFLWLSWLFAILKYVFVDWNKFALWTLIRGECSKKTTSTKRVQPMCKHWKAQTRKKSTLANPPSRKSKSLVHPEEQRASQQGISRSTEDKISVSLFPEEHKDDDVEPNETVTSALINYSYLMLALLNDEWLIWTIKTPQKSVFMTKKLQDESLMGQVSLKSN